MSRPRLEDGFIQLAYELDAAFEIADFTKPQRIVLRAMKAECYGSAKSRSVAVSASAIAVTGGWKREFVQRGIGDLIRENVILRDGPGHYRINKYYQTWRPRGGAESDPPGGRFTPAELTCIAASKRNRPSQPVTRELQGVELGSYSEGTTQLQGVELPSYTPGTTQLQESNYLVTPHIEERARRNIPEYLDSKEAAAAEGAPTLAHAPTHEGTGSEWIEDNALLRAWVDEHFSGPDAPERAKIQDVGLKVPTLLGLARGRASWVHRALFDALLIEPPPRQGYAAYASGALKRWSIEGGPEKDDERRRAAAERFNESRQVEVNGDGGPPPPPRVAAPDRLAARHAQLDDVIERVAARRAAEAQGHE